MENATKWSYGGLQYAFTRVRDNILHARVWPAQNAAAEPILVKREALSSETDDLGVFRVEARGAGFVVMHGDRALLDVAACALEAIDVVRYVVDGEKPEIEVLKTVDGERTAIKNLLPTVDRRAYRGKLELAFRDEECIFGLGQDEKGSFNHRGELVYLYQHNMRIPMPCLVSDQGYGLLIDCASLMAFDDTKKPCVVTLDTVDQIDLYLIEGDPRAIVAGFRALTGKAALIPKWAFGYIQSKERYDTQDEMLAVARRYRELGIPIDCVVQDWKTWEGAQWGQKTVDKARFPDLTSMNAALHELHIHSMVSIWPNMAEGCPDHEELARAGCMLNDYSTYDAFDERARAIYWKQANAELFAGGYDSWWCDSTEPFTSPDWCGPVLLPENTRYEIVGGEHKKYLDPARTNAYALAHAQGIYENQRKTGASKRVLNLTRSGYPGIQQYGTVLWAGDTSATWSELRGEIAKALNMSMCGIPFWTVDIGAFFTGGTACWRKWCGNPDANPVWFWNGDYDDGVAHPGYRELYTRWLQFGAYLPLFRSHGTDTPREIWHFGDRGDACFDAIESAIRQRYRMLPYIYSLAARAAHDDDSMIQSLWAAFPDDRQTRAIADQFLLGDSMLVCPVVEAMYYDKNGAAIDAPKERACYLPAGADWYDFATGALHRGGQWLRAKADIATIPVFVRAGSILPLQRPVSHALENRDAFDIAIYPGADATFLFYDDDGVSYAYEDGDFETLKLTWDDGARTLTIEEISKWRKDPMELRVSCDGATQLCHFDGTRCDLRFA